MAPKWGQNWDQNGAQNGPENGPQKGPKRAPQKAQTPVFSLCFCSKGGAEGPPKRAPKMVQNWAKLGSTWAPKWDPKSGLPGGHFCTVFLQCFCTKHFAPNIFARAARFSENRAGFNWLIQSQNFALFLQCFCTVFAKKYRETFSEELSLFWVYIYIYIYM